MTDCIFCKIVEKEIPANIVYEDKFVMAFLDINPSSPGHTVVIPKMHAETFFELPEDTVRFVFPGVKKTLQILKSTLNPDGFTIGINNGKAAGQEVGHMHIHLIPRNEGDGGVPVNSVVRNTSNESIDDVFKKIQEGLKNK